MNTLYLTTAEKKLFDALPEAVQNGWKVEDETLEFQDTEHRRYMRMSVMKLHDPRLLGLRDELEKVKSDPKAAIKKLDEIDMSTINNDDLLQIFYAMGPDAISFMVIQLLFPGATDDSLKMVAALSSIRNMILRAFVQAYSFPSYT